MLQSLRTSLCAVFLLGAAIPLSARPHWIRVTTSHFEMYTDESEKQAIDAIAGFEQVRYFFLKTNTHQLAPEDRVRIIAFSSEKEYRPYRFNAGAFAYYQQSHQRDYIVMQDIQEGHNQVAVHEYTHLIVQHMKLNIPIWLNEGMADLYSSLEPKGQKAVVGRPLPPYVEILRTQTWMDWNTLFAVDHDSPFYNVPEKMHIFYAQSWVLTHMLELGPAYSSGFKQFLAAVASGTPTAQALQKVYGKTVAEVAKDVNTYVHQSTVMAAIFDVSLSKKDLEPQIDDVPQFDLDLALADLLSTNPATAGQAREKLAALEEQNPSNVELEVSMGYLAWQQNNLEETRKHFRVAIDHGLKKPALLYQYALLLQETNPAPAVLEGLLQKLLELQPDNIDARLLLAGTALNAQHYAVALSALTPIHSVSPENAYRFFTMNAFARSRLDDREGAKENATRALKYAKTPEESMQIQALLSYLDQNETSVIQTAQKATEETTEEASPPPSQPAVHASLARVQAKTKFFECVGNGGGYRLHVQAGTREMVFALPTDPRQVLVRNTSVGGNAITMFTCGPQKPKDLTVVYSPPARSKDDGVVTELIY